MQEDAHASTGTAFKNWAAFVQGPKDFPQILNAVEGFLRHTDMPGEGDTTKKNLHDKVDLNIQNMAKGEVLHVRNFLQKKLDEVRNGQNYRKKEEHMANYSAAIHVINHEIIAKVDPRLRMRYEAANTEFRRREPMLLMERTAERVLTELEDQGIVTSESKKRLGQEVNQRIRDAVQRPDFSEYEKLQYAMQPVVDKVPLMKVQVYLSEKMQSPLKVAKYIMREEEQTPLCNIDSDFCKLHNEMREAVRKVTQKMAEKKSNSGHALGLAG